MIFACIFLVMASFEPTKYAVTEGINASAKLMLVRSGYTNRTDIVTVTTLSGSALGMPEYIIIHCHICTWYA